MCSRIACGDWIKATKMISLILFLRHETPAAYLLSVEPFGESAWVPKSQCEEGKRFLGDLGEPDLIELEMPEWLAETKGLV